MAFAIKYSDPSGDEVEGAYARIRHVHLDMNPAGPSIAVQLEVYRSAEAKAAGKRPLGGMDFTFKDAEEVTREVEKTVEGKKVTEVEVVTPASDVFTRAYAGLARGGDIRAFAYEFLGAERPEFADAKEV